MIALQDNPPISYSATNSETPIASVFVNKDSTWAVAYCMPRQEKSLAWELHRLGISYFLPMVQRETSSGGRRRQNLYPLFASYLFFTTSEDERLAVLRTNRVLQIIDVEPSQQMAFRQELAALEAAVKHAPDSIELYSNLTPGALVEITAGPLKGVKGGVISAGNKRKVLLKVTALGVGVTVEINAAFLEAC